MVKRNHNAKSCQYVISNAHDDCATNNKIIKIKVAKHDQSNQCCKNCGLGHRGKLNWPLVLQKILITALKQEQCAKGNQCDEHRFHRSFPYLQVRLVKDERGHFLMPSFVTAMSLVSLKASWF